jgi:hypothetical protein
MRHARERCQVTVRIIKIFVGAVLRHRHEGGIFASIALSDRFNETLDYLNRKLQTESRRIKRQELDEAKWLYDFAVQSVNAIGGYGLWLKLLNTIEEIEERNKAHTEKLFRPSFAESLGKEAIK